MIWGRRGKRPARGKGCTTEEIILPGNAEQLASTSPMRAAPWGCMRAPSTAQKVGAIARRVAAAKATILALPLQPAAQSQGLGALLLCVDSNPFVSEGDPSRIHLGRSNQDPFPCHPGVVLARVAPKRSPLPRAASQIHHAPLSKLLPLALSLIGAMPLGAALRCGLGGGPGGVESAGALAACRARAGCIRAQFQPECHDTCRCRAAETHAPSSRPRHEK